MINFQFFGRIELKFFLIDELKIENWFVFLKESAFKRSRMSAMGPHGDPDAKRMAVEVFTRLCYYSREGNLEEVEALLTREDGSEFLDLNKQDSLGIAIHLMN